MSELNIFMPDKLEQGFSPLKYKSQFDLWGMACLYQGVCMYDEDLNLSNRLAENVFHAERYMEIKIKPLTWHDGAPITAEDFKFSFELCYAPSESGRIPNRIIEHIEGARSFYGGKSGDISGIKLLDERTIRIYHNAPGVYVQSLLTLPIMPMHCHNQATTQYVGSGSFVLKSILENNAHFVKNEGFCLGTPQVDELFLKGGTTFEQRHYLQEGSIDLTVMEADELLKLPVSVFRNYDVYTLPQPVSTVMKINPDSKLFFDLSARKRVSQKISRGLLVHQLFHNYADSMVQFYPPVVAQHLNCTLIYPNVAPTQTRLRTIRVGVHKQKKEHRNVAEMLAKMLKPDFSVSIDEYSSRDEAYRSGADLYIENMNHALIPCSNPYIYSNRNAFLKDPEYVHLLELDESLYRNNYHDFIRKYAEEIASILPVIPLYSKHEIQLVSKRVQHLRPDTRGAFWNIHEISVT